MRLRADLIEQDVRSLDPEGKLTQAAIREAARLAEVSPSGIYSWIKGSVKSAGAEKIRNLEKAFGREKDYYYQESLIVTPTREVTSMPRNGNEDKMQGLHPLRMLITEAVELEDLDDIQRVIALIRSLKEAHGKTHDKGKKSRTNLHHIGYAHQTDKG
jgi:transcriptional regulator with XRE-family HTH domain